VDIRDGLKDVAPRARGDAHKPPLLPGLLEGALKSLYSHYARKVRRVGKLTRSRRANGSTRRPCSSSFANNTNVSKTVFSITSPGYETYHPPRGRRAGRRGAGDG